MKPYRIVPFVIVLALCACRPTPPPTEQRPEPQATAQATQMRDAIKEPLDKAKAVEDSTQQAADDQRAAIDAATAQ